MSDPCTWLHHEGHQAGGCDEVSVAGLLGLLADPQTPLPHRDTHEPSGADPYLISVQDDGSAMGQQPILNFTGTGVTVSEDAPNNRMNIDIPGGGLVPHAASHENPLGTDQISVNGLSGELADIQKVEVQQAGAVIGTRKRVNFTNATVADNPGSDRVDVTIPAGGAVPHFEAKIIVDPNAGALHSGATHSRLWNAVQAANALGSTVLVYLVESGIPYDIGNLPGEGPLNPNSSVFFAGAGRGKSTIRWTGAAQVADGIFSAVGRRTGTIHMRNLTINGNLGAFNGIYSSGDLLLDDVEILSCLNNGLDFGGNRGHVRGCRFYANHKSGCKFSVTSHGRVIGNEAVSNSIDWAAEEAGFEIGGYTQLIGNTSHSNSGHGINVTVALYSIVSGNYVELSQKSGIRLKGNVICDSNQIHGSQQYGIQILSGGQRSTVKGNMLYGSGAGFEGILVDDADDSLIENNYVDQFNGVASIYLANGSSGCVVNGNRLICPTGKDGIRITDGLRNVVNGNRINGGSAAAAWAVNETGTADWNNIVGNMASGFIPGFNKIGANSVLNVNLPLL